jgi:hypothetical protein
MKKCLLQLLALWKSECLRLGLKLWEKWDPDLDPKKIRKNSTLSTFLFIFELPVPYRSYYDVLMRNLYFDLVSFQKRGFRWGIDHPNKNLLLTFPGNYFLLSFLKYAHFLLSCWKLSDKKLVAVVIFFVLKTCDGDRYEKQGSVQR